MRRRLRVASVWPGSGGGSPSSDEVAGGPDGGRGHATAGRGHAWRYRAGCGGRRPRDPGGVEGEGREVLVVCRRSPGCDGRIGEGRRAPADRRIEKRELERTRVC